MWVAVAQVLSTRDKDENRRLAVASADAAGRRGARLVVLPEAMLVGFGPPDADLRSVAEPLDGPFVGALEEAARRHDLVVIAGTFEPAPDPARVFNTVVAVGPGGILAAYRKVHLYDALGWRESARVDAGQPSAPGTVLDVGDMRVGVMTCFDLRFPESARVLADLGADTLVVPAAWVAGPGKADQWEILLRARAIENTAYVLAAAQPEPQYSGRSMIIDPTGVVIGSLPPAGRNGDDGLLLAEVSARRIAEVRQTMPVLELRRFGVHPSLPPATARVADPSGTP
jgi:predicted amidohydrolase